MTKLPKWIETLILPLINLLLAFAVLGLVLAFVFAEPNPGGWLAAPGHYAGEYLRLLFGIMDTMITSSISAAREVRVGDQVLLKDPSFRPLLNVIFYATTLIFTGLAVALAFRAGHFNIGGEGQMMLGGLAIGIGIAALTTLDETRLVAYGWVQMLGAFPMIALLFLGAGIAGALWMALPAFLQAYRGSHIVITTIMFNAIATGVFTYALKIEGFIKRPRASELATPQAPDVFRLPTLPLPNWCEGIIWRTNTLDPEVAPGWLLAMPWLKNLACMPAKGGNGNVLFFVAIAAAVLVWWFLRQTTLGFGIRTTGLNQNAARSAGMDPKRITIVALCLSGMLAGFAATNHVLSNGSLFSLREGFTAGLGFSGIAVALLARNNPLAIPFTALIFGMLIQGGVAVQTEWQNEGIDSSIAEAMQGLIVLFIGAFALLFAGPAGWLYRWARRGQAVEEGER